LPVIPCSPAGPAGPRIAAGTTTVEAELVGDIKRDSSLWIKKQGAKYVNFYWQRGYGAFSVGQPDVDIVRDYIDKQKEHHIKKDFKTEYRELLNQFDIEFDEQYVWD
jgi:hypothetical protein